MRRYRVEIAWDYGDPVVTEVEIPSDRYDNHLARFRKKEPREVEADLRRRVTNLRKRYPKAEISWQEVEA